jgi:hypothetical protein
LLLLLLLGCSWRNHVLQCLLLQQQG